jgi:hypothetical protein
VYTIAAGLYWRFTAHHTICQEQVQSQKNIDREKGRQEKEKDRIRYQRSGIKAKRTVDKKPCCYKQRFRFYRYEAQRISKKSNEWLHEGTKQTKKEGATKGTRGDFQFVRN